MILNITGGPGSEPITLAEAKIHLKITNTSVTNEDALITSMIKASRKICENYQKRAYVQQTARYVIDNFPASGCEIEIPMPPLSSVSSIVYVDSAGVTQSLSTSYYTVDTYSEPGRIYESYNYTWPTTRPQRNAVTITFLCGYGTDATNVPEPVKHACKILVSHLYENRELMAVMPNMNLLPVSAFALLDGDRVHII
jgi:uncharacterized phiE125 gp8 family phage protein